jgi:glycosyltransferase involved in cell wall biosynthesis
MKLLFFHNSLPEYRIGLFEELSRQCQVKFIITNPNVYEEKYGFCTSKEQKFDCLFLTEGKQGFKDLQKILEKIGNYDAVELPPLDTLREVRMGKRIVTAAKKHHVKIGFFWEKWEAPKDKQPIERKMKNLILRIVPKQVYRNADVIHAGSISAKKYFISNGIPNNKIVVIPDVSTVPNCEYVDLRTKYHIPDNKLVLLYFGRVMQQKGLDYLIRAVAELNRTDNVYYLLIAGEGEFKDACIRLSEQLGLKNIKFCGAVEPKQRKNYFEQCDVFCFPGTNILGVVDVWGLTVNEAIQFNKPVVATEAVGSAIDLIYNGVNGYRCKVEDVSDLVHGIKVASRLDQKKLIETDQRINERYNFKEMAKEIIETFV